jgi:hypothetical protein
MQRRILLFLALICCSTAVNAQQLHWPAKDSMGFSKSLLIIPKNYYVQHLGFFCKTEWRLQKFTSLNLFVRLGSKEYVDYLERKHRTPGPSPAKL